MEDIFNNIDISDILLSHNMSGVELLVNQVKLRQIISIYNNGELKHILLYYHNTYGLLYYNSEHLTIMSVQRGRWNITQLEHRTCSICKTNYIESKFHYLFTCTYFVNFWLSLLMPYYYIKPLIPNNKIIIITTTDSVAAINTETR